MQGEVHGTWPARSLPASCLRLARRNAAIAGLRSRASLVSRASRIFSNTLDERAIRRRFAPWPDADSLTDSASTLLAPALVPLSARPGAEMTFLTGIGDDEEELFFDEGRLARVRPNLKLVSLFFARSYAVFLELECRFSVLANLEAGPNLHPLHEMGQASWPGSGWLVERRMEKDRASDASGPQWVLSVHRVEVSEEPCAVSLGSLAVVL